MDYGGECRYRDRQVRQCVDHPSPGNRDGKEGVLQTSARRNGVRPGGETTPELERSGRRLPVAFGKRRARDIRRLQDQRLDSRTRWKRDQRKPDPEIRQQGKVSAADRPTR